jgi:uncharacterized membrane protein
LVLEVEETVYSAAVFAGLLAALTAPIVVWKAGAQALRWNWSAVAVLVPAGLYFGLKMPGESYDYSGARGVFSVIVLVTALCVVSIGLSWGVGRVFRSRLG